MAKYNALISNLLNIRKLNTQIINRTYELTMKLQSVFCANLLILEMLIKITFCCQL